MKSINWTPDRTFWILKTNTGSKKSALQVEIDSRSLSQKACFRAFFIFLQKSRFIRENKPSKVKNKLCTKEIASEGESLLKVFPSFFLSFFLFSSFFFSFFRSRYSLLRVSSLFFLFHQFLAFSIFLFFLFFSHSVFFFFFFLRNPLGQFISPLIFP